MKSVLITALTFTVTIPVLATLLSSFYRPDLTAEVSGCSNNQVFRVSDNRCYSLQGE